MERAPPPSLPPNFSQANLLGISLMRLIKCLSSLLLLHLFLSPSLSLAPSRSSCAFFLIFLIYFRAHRLCKFLLLSLRHFHYSSVFLFSSIPYSLSLVPPPPPHSIQVLLKNCALIFSKKSEFVFKILAHNLFSRVYKSFHFRATSRAPRPLKAAQYPGLPYPTLPLPPSRLSLMMVILY